jgi:nucleoside-diphosphate-sugar epimerase
VENKAIVVGALGVIGRYIVERLVEEPDWQVVVRQLSELAFRFFGVK